MILRNAKVEHWKLKRSCVRLELVETEELSKHNRVCLPERWIRAIREKNTNDTGCHQAFSDDPALENTISRESYACERAFKRQGVDLDCEHGEPCILMRVGKMGNVPEHAVQFLCTLLSSFVYLNKDLTNGCFYLQRQGFSSLSL